MALQELTITNENLRRAGSSANRGMRARHIVGCGDEAAHAVSQEAFDAGVWVCGSGLADQRVSTVAADGTVTDGPPVTVGGLTVIEVPSREEALRWAAKWAAACRCDQQVWELGFDPKINAMFRQADPRESRPDDA